MRKESNKIQIPNVESEYVERPADLLFDSYKERIIVVNAGAGYGKTQMLAHFVSRCGDKSAWYSLSETDNELMSFVHNFTKSVDYALGKRDNDFKACFSGQEDLDILVENLVLWLDGRAGRLNVVLDDFQEIHNPDIFNLLGVLMETLGEKIRFFIVEMRSLPAFLEEYMDNGQAACIGAEDLKFRMPDIERLLGSIPGTGIQKPAAEIVYYCTEGWPVGVVQIMQQLRRQRKAVTLETVKGICEKLEVSDYFMTRVYQMLPFDIQTFLKRTAVLDYMTVSACNYILGNYESASMLKYLVKEKLFVQSLGEQSGVYRYHSIFQRFLLSQISRQEQTDSLKKAAYYFLKTEDKIQAAEYGCRGGAAEVVQAAIEVSGEEILEERLYDTLKRWFEFLKERHEPLTPKARFVYGRYLWELGSAEEARKQIMEASEAFYKEGKLKDYKQVLLFLAAAERRAGNLTHTGSCLQQIENPPEKIRGRLAAMICTEQVKYACCLHQTERARSLLEEWGLRGEGFEGSPFLHGAEQVFVRHETEDSALRPGEIEDGFLLQNCILAEKLAASYQEADFSAVFSDAQQIIHNSEYETLHTAIAWKMLAILSWNQKNYRKAAEQAKKGDAFLYKNGIRLQDFSQKHQQILGEINFLQKNAAAARQFLPRKEESSLHGQEGGGKIRIQCMKRFCVMLTDGEEREIRWRTKKAQELFAYLFHLQGGGISREELITLLWPESGTKSATALFHTTLYSIRQVFTQEGRGDLIVYDKKKYSLNMQMVSSDLEELQAYFQGFRNKKEEPERAIGLYPGGYMENTGYLWAYGTAKKLEDEYLLVCRAGAKERMGQNREDLAIPFLQSMQEIEPYDEEIVEALIVCLYRSRRQTEAKQQYDRMVKLYKEDLDLDFGKTFQELVRCP